MSGEKYTPASARDMRSKDDSFDPEAFFSPPEPLVDEDVQNEVGSEMESLENLKKELAQLQAQYENVLDATAEREIEIVERGGDVDTDPGIERLDNRADKLEKRIENLRVKISDQEDRRASGDTVYMAPVVDIPVQKERRVTGEIVEKNTLEQDPDELQRLVNRLFVQNPDTVGRRAMKDPQETVVETEDQIMGIFQSISRKEGGITDSDRRLFEKGKQILDSYLQGAESANRELSKIGQKINIRKKTLQGELANAQKRIG